MKWTILLFTSVSLVLATGCATQKRVADMEGRSSHVVFRASPEQAWTAALAAAQTNGLHVAVTNISKGYIGASSGPNPAGFGDNVGIWVHGITPTLVSVDVVSKHAGPTLMVMRNWEDPVLHTMAADVPRADVPLGEAKAPVPKLAPGPFSGFVGWWW